MICLVENNLLASTIHPCLLTYMNHQQIFLTREIKAPRAAAREEERKRRKKKEAICDNVNIATVYDSSDGRGRRKEEGGERDYEAITNTAYVHANFSMGLPLVKNSFF